MGTGELGSGVPPRQATEYESAYAALVEGRYEACREMVARRRLDKAWQMLASQLGQRVPWG